MSDKEPLYPCDGCGVMRTKAEGGTTFTVCDACWDKHFRVATAREQVAERDVALDKAVLRVAELELERQALLVVWQDGPSLPDCHACAVLGAALRGEGEK